MSHGDSRTSSTGVARCIGTLNIRCAHHGNLEATLRGLKEMHVDIAVLTETQLTYDKHTTNRFGYTVFGSFAQSSSKGGVALAFKANDGRFCIEQFKRSVWQC